MTARDDALDECRRCRGRVFGDCSDECRYFALSASEAELATRHEQQRRKGSGAARPWLGPTCHVELFDNQGG